MPKPFLRNAFVLFLGLTILLAACSQETIPTPLVETATPEPTATQELIPVTSDNTNGTVILSLEEDGYAHLFAYAPGGLPLTRLTNGDWDDITPAPSPDGTRLAFASNRLGHWDLFLLDLASGDLTQLTNTPEYEGAPTWSPDGSFLAYETYLNGNLDIAVGPGGQSRQRRDLPDRLLRHGPFPRLGARRTPDRLHLQR